MQTVSDLIRSTAPASAGGEAIRCIETCLLAAHACVACADACTGAADPRAMTRCIRLDLDCADICQTTLRVVSRQQHPEPALIRAQLELCALACRRCAEECERHANEHCKVCAQACRWCEEACRELAVKIPGGALH